MATKITAEDIIKINELYLKYKVKAQVARELNISPSTVSKYIREGYISTENQEKIIFDKSIPQVPIDYFQKNLDWGLLCFLTKEEIEALNKMQWKVQWL